MNGMGWPRLPRAQVTVWIGLATSVACALAPGAASAQGGASAARRATADTVLVSPAWLEARLAEPRVVVLFAGSTADYDAGHVPGARHFPSAAFTAQGRAAADGPSLMTELPAMATLDSALEAVGVGDSSRIVVYGGATAAARLYVTLDHAGLGARTSILDDGMVAWREAGHQVTTVVPVVARGSLTLRPRNDVIADLAAIRAATSSGGVAVLDARLPEFYSGASAGQMPRAGRIPTARNVPYTSLLTRGATFRDVAELQGLFTAAGVQPGGLVITYCHIGMQASVLYVAARAAGYDARMYDGSFDEWSRRADMPVVRDSSGSR